MNRMSKRTLFLIVALVLTTVSGDLTAQEARNRKGILSNQSFWRYHYALKPPVMRKDGQLKQIELTTPKTFIARSTGEVGKWLYFDTPLPPNDWKTMTFNDVGWHRKPLVDPDSPWVAHLALRGKFRIDDRQKVKGLMLHVKYRGGVVVYVNGREMVRGHLRKGAGPGNVAEDYPPDNVNETRELAEVRIPSGMLRNGVNVLALEVHRSAQPESAIKMVSGYRTFEGGTCGILDVRLSTQTADGISPNVARPKGLQVWNSGPMTADFDVDHGDPNEPIRPIRLVAPQGGAASGKVVVGSDEPIKGLRGSASSLSCRTGGRIPVSAVQIRYALPTGTGHRGSRRVGRFDALAEEPLVDVPVRKGKGRSRANLVFGAVQPVWVTVEVPEKTKAGDYVGNLTLSIADGKSIQVPIHLKVCAWQVPAPTYFRTFVDIIESPESVAMQYEVPLWSDAHFRLME